MNLCDFDLDLFKIGDFIVKEVEIGNKLSATLQQDVLSLNFLLPFDFLHFRLVLLQKLSETFLGVLLPKIAVFLEILLDVFSVFHNEVEIL